MRVAIVEDMAEERLRMKEYAQAYFEKKQIEAELLFFEDGKVFLEQYPGGLDLILMDIEMPHMDGLEAARRLRSFDEKVQLLFVTRMIQFALEGYSVDAADFLVKPIRFPVFCSRMDRALRRLEASAPRFLTTRQGREELCCPVQQITYIESLNKKTIIHMQDGSTRDSSEALYVLEKKLEQEPFFRCHNSFLVNMDWIRSIRALSVVVDKEELPVSKYRKKEFLQALANYRGRML